MMKQIKNTNILSGIKIFGVISILTFCSCDDDTYTPVDSESIECEYCFEEKPELVELCLNFNMKEGMETVEFIVFSGDVFDSEIFMKGVADKNKYWILVEPDYMYSIVAIYIRSGKKYFVVNDRKVKTQFFRTGCKKPCHYVYETYCDLKLRLPK